MTYASLNSQIFSPIQMLPVELLSQIFALTTHSIDGEEDPSFPTIEVETIKTPIILSRVSHHWRNVVRTTASLWTSICVTAEPVGLGAGHSPTRFSANRLLTYLALSQNYPLDILIDARDEDWDFSEADSMSLQIQSTDYTPPFSSSHMSSAISLLLPHISRWRSFGILTDTWAPMYVALQQIQPYIISTGAPNLESLTLMRCNDFVSYSSTFEPHGMRDPAFLNLSGTSKPPYDILPRLRNLTLRGVHVHWSSLSCILSHNSHGLDRLDLSSHCIDVRPTLPEFHQLLQQCPQLKKLTVNSSGPRIPRDHDSGGLTISNQVSQRVPLPHLREMIIGYRTVPEGSVILEAMDAPCVRSLTLVDSSHPLAVDDIDTGSLLSYLATGNFLASGNHDSLIAFNSHSESDEQLQAANEKGPHPFTNLRAADVPHNTTTTRAVFPLLEEVTMRGLKACPSLLHAFFGVQPNLRHLEFNNMSMPAIVALFPGFAYYGTEALCPCPLLQSLCIRGSEAQIRDSVYLIKDLAVDRFNKGGSMLQKVDIHIDNTDGDNTERVVQLPETETTVKITMGIPLEVEEDDLMDCDMDSDSYFEIDDSDPMLDAQYTIGVSGR